MRRLDRMARRIRFLILSRNMNPMQTRAVGCGWVMRVRELPLHTATPRGASAGSQIDFVRLVHTEGSAGNNHLFSWLIDL